MSKYDLSIKIDYYKLDTESNYRYTLVPQVVNLIMTHGNKLSKAEKQEISKNVAEFVKECMENKTNIIDIIDKYIYVELV